jgi:hypothetical protein
MWDKINGPIKRSAFQPTAPTGTVCDVASGDAGLWMNNGKFLYRRTSPVVDTGLVQQRGVIPSARMAFSAAPGNTDPFAIGTATFQFLTTLIAATTYTQIKRLATPALTLAATLDAINGVSNANVVPGSTLSGLPAIVADAVSATVLRIRKADAIGGNAIAGTVTSTALSCTITAGASAWSVANLNASGKAESDCQISTGQVAITAAMVTNASFQVELPFTPTSAWCFVTSSAGVQRASTDAITISGNAINIALGGGASPAIQAGDLVNFMAVE